MLRMLGMLVEGGVAMMSRVRPMGALRGVGLLAAAALLSCGGGKQPAENPAVVANVALPAAPAPVIVAAPKLALRPIDLVPQDGDVMMYIDLEALHQSSLLAATARQLAMALPTKPGVDEQVCGWHQLERQLSSVAFGMAGQRSQLQLTVVAKLSMADADIRRCVRERLPRAKEVTVAGLPAVMERDGRVIVVRNGWLFASGARDVIRALEQREASPNAQNRGLRRLLDPKGTFGVVVHNRFSSWKFARADGHIRAGQLKFQAEITYRSDEEMERAIGRIIGNKEDAQPEPSPPRDPELGAKNGLQEWQGLRRDLTLRLTEALGEAHPLVQLVNAAVLRREGETLHLTLDHPIPDVSQAELKRMESIPAALQRE